jgi:hypothetical protein
LKPEGRPLTGQGVPGRPGLRTWALSLLRPVLENAIMSTGEKGPDKKLVDLRTEFDTLYDDLNKAINARNFGHPAMVMDSATKLINWSDRTMTELERVRFGPESKQRMTDAIHMKLASQWDGKLPVASRPYTDYDSARQLIWSLVQLNPEKYGKLQTDKTLIKTMQISLRDFSAPTMDRQPKIEDLRKDRLEQLYGFHPEDFSKVIQGILK